MILQRAIAMVAIVTLLALPAHVQGDEIKIDIENASPAGGFFFTPVFLGFHDGTYDIFDSGGTASMSLESLAEEGDTSGVAADLAALQATSQSITVVGNSTGPPPFDPGESISTMLDVDTSTQRFLNYASMVIPSNDAFFGNATALELFDASGVFLGPQTIEITAGMIYDAGTELNDINGGAAFSANGGTSTDESNPIALIDLDDLNDFVGTQTVSGATISSPLAANTVVARFTITSVPEPGSVAVLGLLGMAGLIRRRRA